MLKLARFHESEPERDFEDISLDAARSYFGHNTRDGSYLFGFPRRTDEKAFSAAVDKLSVLLGEGGGAKSVGPARDQKDAYLDLRCLARLRRPATPAR